MEPNKDHIKDIFSSKLSGFKPEVPLAAWNNIEKQLADTVANPIINKRVTVRKQIINIGSWVAAVAAVVFVFIYIYPRPSGSLSQGNVFLSELFTQKTQFKRFDKNVNRALAEVDDERCIYPSKKTMQNHSTPFVAANPKQSSKIKEVVSLENTNTFYSIKDSVDNSFLTSSKMMDNLFKDKGDSIIRSTQLALEGDRELKKEKALKVFELEREHLDDLLADNTSIEQITRSNENKGFLLGLQGGSGFFKSDDTKKQLTTYSGNNSGISVTRESKLKMKHNQPITFGVTISKKINNKLSLESGIVYIYLSSRFKTEEVASIRQNDMQHLHYFGLPLTLNYNLAEWSKLKLYGSLGGLIQKDFYGRKSGNTYINGILQPDFYHKRKISQKNPQFSINAGLGLSYPLYNQLRVYSNFGGAYYLNAKNEYETIYSDKKWLFNLNIGLRFEF